MSLWCIVCWVHMLHEPWREWTAIDLQESALVTWVKEALKKECLAVLWLDWWNYRMFLRDWVSTSKRCFKVVELKSDYYDKIHSVLTVHNLDQIIGNMYCVFESHARLYSAQNMKTLLQKNTSPELLLFKKMLYTEIDNRLYPWCKAIVAGYFWLTRRITSTCEYISVFVENDPRSDRSKMYWWLLYSQDLDAIKWKTRCTTSVLFLEEGWEDLENIEE